MKRSAIVLLLFLFFAPGIYAQANETSQLVLNWQKLQQLRDILDNMYKGYEILTKGYNTIKDISEGNFKLHEVFLDGLFEVSPVVRDYKRIADIVKYQQALVKDYKRSWNRFKQDPNFTPDELRYIEKVYNHLFRQSLKNLDELIMATTASNLRMSDDERLQTIDRIFLDIEDKLAFLRHFNSGAQALAMQRAKERHDVETLRKLYAVDQ